MLSSTVATTLGLFLVGSWARDGPAAAFRYETQTDTAFVFWPVFHSSPGSYQAIGVGVLA